MVGLGEAKSGSDDGGLLVAGGSSMGSFRFVVSTGIGAGAGTAFGGAILGGGAESVFVCCNETGRIFSRSPEVNVARG